MISLIIASIDRSDFLIKPLESLLGSHNHYPDPITADDYLHQRLAEIKLK